MADIGFAGVPSPEDCVLSAMLERQARKIGSSIFAVFDTGETWTYDDARRQARQTAAALSRLGVGRGDPVLVWLPNGPDVIRICLALSYLGAVFVPINLALRGGMLEHIVRDSQAQLLICHADLVDRLDIIDTSTLKTVALFGGPEPVQDIAGLRVLGEDVLVSDGDIFPSPQPEVAAWDTAAIFYTSGTTGPSKGVICPHMHIFAMGPLALRFMSAQDRFLINLPFFHLAAALVPSAVLHFGASMAVMTNFRTSTFWDEVRRLEATACYILSAMSSFLMKAPQRDNDNTNPLRHVIQQPLAPDAAEFARRFDVTVYTQFDMTEMGPAILSDGISAEDEVRPGYCGQAWTGWPFFETRIVDQNDNPVPPGKAGELVVRCATPWVIAPGYHGMPDATAKAWRNGWFHTGDSMRLEADGSYFFVDRMKDAIRRRGENISSSELEAEVVLHPDVAAVAAIAAKSEYAEDEVMLVVQPKPGAEIDPVELTNFLVPRLPHYAVPRYVRFVDELPLTVTRKVQKTTLREAGVTSDTWDREAAGIVLKRAIIGNA